MSFDRANSGGTLLGRSAKVFGCLALAGALFGAASTINMVVSTPASAQSTTVTGSVSGPVTKRINLGLSKSVIVELPRNAKDVLVSDPETADAVVRSARRAYVIGREVGRTNIFFFDGNGEQILALDVHVQRDMGALARTIKNLLPGSHIAVDSVNDNVILTGSVRTPADAKTASDIAGRFVGNPEGVVNMLDVEGEEQILLKVAVAEVERSTIKQLGINLSAVAEGGNLAFSALTQNPFSLEGQPIANTFGRLGPRPGENGVSGTIQALEQRGLLRTLAEPTLTAISGEKAEFLAGGEFPVPVARDQDGNVTVDYKPFGVALSFTPVVLSEGRISLNVRTEVSELTSEGAFTLRGGVADNGTTVADLTIPALKVRRASSTIELPSGGSLAMAGLLQEDIRQNINGVPGLMDVPVLGTLFRSRDFQKSETELVIIVTPYTVRPTSSQQLARPTDGLLAPSDPETIFLGRLNRIYSANGGTRPTGRLTGHHGFIID